MRSCTDGPKGPRRRREPPTTGPRARQRSRFPLSPTGAYRLLYETTDDFGAVCKTSKDFLVAAPDSDVALPAICLSENSTVPVGGTARFLVHSGLPGQVIFLDIYRDGTRVERRRLISDKDSSLMEMPVTEKDRGGFGVTMTVLRDHQVMQFSRSVFVPWDNKELKVEFATFRDKLKPGGRETWRVTVKAPGESSAEPRAAELLAYMYDRSLDLFAPHNPPRVGSLYPNRSGAGTSRVNLGQASSCYSEDWNFVNLPAYPSLREDELAFYRFLRHRRAGTAVQTRWRGRRGTRRHGGGIGRPWRRLRPHPWP